MPPATPAVIKPKHTKQTLLRLISQLFADRLSLTIVVLGVIINGAANIYGTWLLKPLINDYLTPMLSLPPGEPLSFAPLRSFVLWMATIYGLGVISVLVYKEIMVELSTKIILDLRLQLFAVMEKLPLSYHDQHPHGETMSLYTNDINAMHEMVSETIPEFIASILRVVGVFTMMLLMSPLLASVTVVMLVLIIWVSKLLGSHSIGFFRQRQESVAKINGYIEEMVEGQPVIKAFGREQTSIEEFAVLNRKMYLADAGAYTYSCMLFPVVGNLSQVLFALTATIGGLAAIYRGLDIGTLAAMLQYTRNLAMPIAHIAQQVNSILSALAGAERIYALLDEKPEVDEGKVTMVQAHYVQGQLQELDPQEVGKPTFEHIWAWKKPVPKAEGSLSTPQPQYTLQPVKGEVIFKDVSFSYDERQKVLDNISLYATPGQRIAFVGSTGAGKTTITNLLNRFYDISQGSITYDGIPIKEISKASLRRSLAVVLQDTHLFTGTVMENIRYGNPQATDEEVYEAAKLANASSFITLLPQGFRTMLKGDGASLSQGQRQLLSIARAAVAAPPVLVLDEATSSVDTRTEALIEQGMDCLMKGRTVFVIAHRLSTVKSSNAIMVLEHGRIIERGDHDDLIQQNGRYAQLYNGSFELE